MEDLDLWAGKIPVASLLTEYDDDRLFEVCWVITN